MTPTSTAAENAKDKVERLVAIVIEAEVVLAAISINLIPTAMPLVLLLLFLEIAVALMLWHHHHH